MPPLGVYTRCLLISCIALSPSYTQPSMAYILSRPSVAVIQSSILLYSITGYSACLHFGWSDGAPMSVLTRGPIASISMFIGSSAIVYIWAYCILFSCLLCYTRICPPAYPGCISLYSITILLFILLVHLYLYVYYDLCDFFMECVIFATPIFFYFFYIFFLTSVIGYAILFI